MEVSPAPVVGHSTLCYAGGWSTAVIAHEAPGHEACDSVADRPPDGQKRNQPGMGPGKKLQEVGRVQDVVSTSTSGIDRNPGKHERSFAVKTGSLT